MKLVVDLIPIAIGALALAVSLFVIPRQLKDAKNTRQLGVLAGLMEEFRRDEFKAHQDYIFEHMPKLLSESATLPDSARNGRGR